MPFVRKADIDQHWAGSLEQRMEIAAKAVRDAVGDGAKVLATHESYALAQAQDGTVQRVTYQLQEGQAEDVAAAVAEDVPCLDGLGLDRVAAHDLRGAVSEMLKGSVLDRTRVRDLARMVKGDVPYWIDEAVDRLDKAGSGAEWWEYYAPQEPEIREGLHGSIRELESPVPKTRFSKLAEKKLPEVATELRECVGQLKTVAGGLFDDLATDVAYHTEDLATRHKSLRMEAQGIRDALAWIEQMEWNEEHLPVVATAHDRIAARLRNGVIMSAHLRAMTREEDNDKEAQ